MIAACGGSGHTGSTSETPAEPGERGGSTDYDGATANTAAASANAQHETLDPDSAVADGGVTDGFTGSPAGADEVPAY